MKISRLTHRVLFVEPAYDIDATGNPVRNGVFATMFQAWCEVAKHITESKMDAPGPVTVNRITIRCRPISGITLKHEFEVAGFGVFRVTAVTFLDRDAMQIDGERIGTGLLP